MLRACIVLRTCCGLLLPYTVHLALLAIINLRFVGNNFALGTLGYIDTSISKDSVKI